MKDVNLNLTLTEKQKSILLYPQIINIINRVKNYYKLLWGN